MPLPTLKRYRVETELAREYQKRKLLGESPERAAAAVGGSVAKLEQDEAGQALARAVEPEELELLRNSPIEHAAPALNSREAREKWLLGVRDGTIRFEGAFGNMKQFPPAARIAAAALLGKMGGDYVQKHEVTVTEERVFVFQIPDNGRVPEQLVVDAPPQE